MATDSSEALDAGLVDLAPVESSEASDNAVVVSDAAAPAEGVATPGPEAGKKLSKAEKKAAVAARKEAEKASKAAKAKAAKAARAKQPKPPMTVYSWMLILALIFLMIGSAVLVFELKRYNFEIREGFQLFKF